jgi:hypothetical protein
MWDLVKLRKPKSQVVQYRIGSLIYISEFVKLLQLY